MFTSLGIILNFKKISEFTLSCHMYLFTNILAGSSVIIFLSLKTIFNCKDNCSVIVQKFVSMFRWTSPFNQKVSHGYLVCCQHSAFVYFIVPLPGHKGRQEPVIIIKSLQMTSIYKLASVPSFLTKACIWSSFCSFICQRIFRCWCNVVNISLTEKKFIK